MADGARALSLRKPSGVQIAQSFSSPHEPRQFGAEWLAAVFKILGLGLKEAFGSGYKPREDRDLTIEFLHPFLIKGLPASSLTALAGVTTIFRIKEHIQVLGMSPSTFYRVQRTPNERLTGSQTSQTYQFAEIYAQALDVLGTREAADSWFQTPAKMLGYTKPIDLISTQPGWQKVRQYLTQMDYGVYS
jgi:putative toxin-antitoxin system antitoxin component (TIGR02293 family)